MQGPAGLTAVVPEQAHPTTGVHAGQRRGGGGKLRRGEVDLQGSSGVLRRNGRSVLGIGRSWVPQTTLSAGFLAKTGTGGTNWSSHERQSRSESPSDPPGGGGGSGAPGDPPPDQTLRVPKRDVPTSFARVAAEDVSDTTPAPGSSEASGRRALLRSCKPRAGSASKVRQAARGGDSRGCA